jgi:hypothetical protein
LATAGLGLAATDELFVVALAFLVVTGVAACELVAMVAGVVLVAATEAAGTESRSAAAAIAAR